MAQVLGNDRFREFLKLKEFISATDQIKNFANMDQDDPVLHNRLYRFIKTTGKSFLSYAWGEDADKARRKASSKLDKFKHLDPSSEKSAEEIGLILNGVKINTQISNLTEL
eukprot:CAMPEP_0168321072 /NCGR_PEP_ID=MMETSP0213-20121227/2048_1 /TAXON_ID=151035 /ORGANISM="Euplotes harpa, Strain FSP1.4" /LENGTH=110 /DNA_ID=CAMNT_0008322643 /DNA_START=398 /DNA_END=730 /DNA_ORIENTATION=-